MPKVERAYPAPELVEAARRGAAGRRGAADRQLRARRTAAASATSRRWRGSPCCGRPSSPACRRVEVRTISNRPARVRPRPVADRGRARARSARSFRRCSRSCALRHADLRVLAVPERHVRVPRARARAGRRAVRGRAGAARHRGAEPAGARRRARPDEAVSFGAFARRRRPLPDAAQRRGARPRRRAARRRARGERSPAGAPDRDPGPRDDRVPAPPARRAGARRGRSSCATTRSSARSADGEVDAGLIIHESRFTYADHGLVAVADLGEWWERETGLPVPLGRDLRAPGPRRRRPRPSAAIRASVEYAFAHPEASREYVRAHSQEMSDEVVRPAHRAVRERVQRRPRRGGAWRRSSGCSRRRARPLL